MSVYARGIIKLALEKDRSTYSLLTLLEPKWVEAERERTIIQTIIEQADLERDDRISHLWRGRQGSMPRTIQFTEGRRRLHHCDRD